MSTSTDIEVFNKLKADSTEWCLMKIPPKLDSSGKVVPGTENQLQLVKASVVSLIAAQYKEAEGFTDGVVLRGKAMLDVLSKLPRPTESVDSAAQTDRQRFFEARPLET